MLPKKKIARQFLIFGLLLFPLCLSLYIVSVNSDKLIKGFLSIPLLLVACFSFVMIIFGIVFYFTGKDKTKHKFKKPVVALFFIFITAYTIGGFGVVYKLYFSGREFKEWLITTAMTTMSHQYLATWFYNDYDVSVALANNIVIESAEDTNVDLVDFTKVDFNKTTYASEFEKEVLTKNEGNDLYKIIDINTTNPKGQPIKGKLAVVYDASKVKLGISKGLGTNVDTSYGQMITEIAARYNAVLATNAGGFIDPDWNSWGGVPHGISFSYGTLASNNTKAPVGGGLVGFTNDNVLVLGRYSLEQMKAIGIRDCVEFGPFLIVNGKSSYINGNGGWGQAPRTAIGQRADGIVLLLVIDGRQTASVGADMNDLARIMMDYGAINAANMDGGTSTAMELNGQIISNPRNGSFAASTRPVPNAWIVVE